MELLTAAIPFFSYGDYLDRHAAVVDVERLPATFASGDILATGDPLTVIPGGTVVAVTPTSLNAEAPEFEVTTGETIPGPASPPANLVVTDIAGTLPGGGSGTTYRYVVTALDAAGETLRSNEDDRAVAASATGGARLAWDAVASATGYRVYRGTGALGAGPWDLIATVGAPATTFDDAGAAANGAVQPPTVNTTGGKLLVPIRARAAGIAGNVGAGVIVNVTVGPDIDVTNPAATVGGTEQQSDPELLARVLAAYRNPRGGGRVADYEAWALSEPGVVGVTVHRLQPDGPGSILVVVFGVGGLPVAAETLDALTARRGELPADPVLTLSTSAVLNVTVAAGLDVLDGYSLDGDSGTSPVRELARAAVEAYVESVRSGGEITLAGVIGALMAVDGIHDVPAAGVLINGSNANLAVAITPTPQAPVLGTFTPTEVP